MRAHTASGTAPTLAFAPEPTAIGFLGKRVPGSAPALGTGTSLAPGGGVVCGGVVCGDDDVTGALVRDAMVVKGGAVGASTAAGTPAPQPTSTKEVRATAVVVAVLLRRMARPVRLACQRGGILPRPWVMEG